MAKTIGLSGARGSVTTIGIRVRSIAIAASWAWSIAVPGASAAGGVLAQMGSGGLIDDATPSLFEFVQRRVSTGYGDNDNDAGRRGSAAQPSARYRASAAAM